MIDETKIEQAAEKCAERYFGLPKSLQLGVHCFKLGINWFLDNLWHDASEEPMENKGIMIEYLYDNDKKFVKLGFHKPSYYPWQQKIINEKITRWLYIEDLLKGGK